MQRLSVEGWAEKVELTGAPHLSCTCSDLILSDFKCMDFVGLGGI